MLMQGLSAARQKLERKVNAQLKEAGGSQPELEVRCSFASNSSPQPEFNHH